ncbi:MAG: alpha-L-fucosidase [Clostridiales bacterium]|uniref:alpha-L-fucosidase n=1 Tax=Zhenhengia sp. TaxID=2944208 RepID=UPI0029129C7B|nr:alpha-L-fucosidase [Clostridiales bacterium]
MLHNQFEALGLKPYGAVPSRRQMDWYRREATAFFHFGVNTFTDLEWGDGTEAEKMFNPTELDCRQWMRVIKQAGFTTAILTAKHHDGFCLWPSEYSEHTIAKSPYKEGKGDVVREFVEACHEYGIKPGLYLSPWDRHSKYWGTDAYNTYYNNQLTELMTQYGKIYECWWDGAGSTEAQYDWGRWAYTVRTHQPDCIIFGSLGATEYVEARWVGNESGYAGNPCWATIDQSSLEIENTVELNSGKAGGNRFIPAEVDVSIRPGWFYHENQDGAVRSAENLVKYWFESSGRNAGILLNFPPDRRGLIHDIDTKNVLNAATILQKTFAVNLLQGAEVSATSEMRPICSADKMLLKDENLFYAADEKDLTPTITFTTKEPITFNCFVLSEVIELGHRVRGYRVEAKVKDEWKVLVDNQCIGFRWAEYFDTITTQEVRIVITDAVVAPVLRSFGVYYKPEVASVTKTVEEVVDLIAQPTTRQSVKDNELEIEFGGIYPFNTLEMNGQGVKAYVFYAFNGTQYEKVYESKHVSAHEKATFEIQDGSYKVKLVIDMEEGCSLENLIDGLGMKIYKSI